MGMGSTDLRVTTQLSRFQLGVKRDSVRGVFYREARGSLGCAQNPNLHVWGPGLSTNKHPRPKPEALPTPIDLSLWR
jgi:hypothetical protein